MSFSSKHNFQNFSKQQHITFQHSQMALRTVENYGMNALVNGVVGGIASYGVMKRTGNVEVFGMDVPEYMADAGICAIGSIGGDIVGQTAIPWALSKMNAPPMLQTATAVVIPALGSGLAVGLGKTYLTDSNNTMGQEFMFGAVVKGVSDGLSRMYM